MAGTPTPPIELIRHKRIQLVSKPHLKGTITHVSTETYCFVQLDDIEGSIGVSQSRLEAAVE